MTARLGAAALGVMIALALAGAARAADITGAHLRTLAAQAAAGDTAALAQLRAVTSVDGQPARVAETLEARTPADLAARLRSLSAGTQAVSGQSPATARNAAAGILEGRRFGGKPVSEPVGTVFDKLGHALSRLARGAPGGPPVFWAIVAAVVLALSAAGTRRMMRRMDPLRSAAGAGRDPDAAETPESLERKALQAERAGAFTDAVRLRFRAGLLALSAREVIEYRPSLLSTEVARRVRSARFDALSESFDRIAYGGAPAGRSDAKAAREGWAAVLREPSR